jgi:diguanylate cyclase (GGDEF)-like protein
MIETAAQPPAGRLMGHRLGWLKHAVRTAMFLASVVAVAQIWRLALGRVGVEGQWLLIQAPLFICTSALAWRFAAGHERRWIVPSRKLARLIDEVRAGEASIESLTEVDGPLLEVADSVQQVLIELRRQEQSNARLQAEIRQRIQNRTDHLERKVASWQTQAFRDTLTGLCNRRQLDERLPKLLDECRADSLPLCVLAVDLDNFKHVNDTQGHDAGDRLLRDVGQLIRSAVREGDWAFRLGGDEFLVLLPGHDWAAGKKLARRLAALVDQMVKTMPTPTKPGLSIGIVCPGDLRKMQAAELLKMADAAMYQEKAVRKTRR